MPFSKYTMVPRIVNHVSVKQGGTSPGEWEGGVVGGFGEQTFLRHVPTFTFSVHADGSRQLIGGEASSLFPHSRHSSWAANNCAREVFTGSAMLQHRR